jgi:hypothetical protein
MPNADPSRWTESHMTTLPPTTGRAGKDAHGDRATATGPPPLTSAYACALCGRAWRVTLVMAYGADGRAIGPRCGECADAA